MSRGRMVLFLVPSEEIASRKALITIRTREGLFTGVLAVLEKLV